MVTTIITIIKVIVLLGLLVIMHEFAHMVVAKLCKVKVTEFSIGFGPLLLKKERKGTVYSLRLIPLGGYVNLLGMDDKECNIEGSYSKANAFKKIAILLAGGIVNILFGLLIYFILVYQASNFLVAFDATKHFTFSMFESIKMLFTGAVTPEQLMGPIGITDLVSETTKISEYIYLTALVSLSLGVTNLLPIPPLDGSKILIIIFETIRRKPIKEETELKIQLAGFLFIILLSLYVAYNDILRLF